MPVEYGSRPRPFGLSNLSPDRVGGSGGNGGPGRHITPAARETRFDRILNGIPRTEGKPLDPYRVSDALMSYQDQVSARIRGLTPKIIVPGELARLVETRAPAQEEQAFLATIQHVRQAFDVLAFSHFPPNYQSVLSGEVYGNPLFGTKPKETHQGEFTLTPAEKKILTQIAAVTGVPDDPEQVTYSYSSIPRIVEGTIRR